MTRRRTAHGIGHRIGNWCCRIIAIECLGGLAYYAARAGSYLTIGELVVLAVVSRLAVHRKRRR